MSKESRMTDPISPTVTQRGWRSGLAGVLACCAWLLLSPAPALADAPAPGWSINSVAMPANLAPGSTNGIDQDQYILTATNTGGAVSTGTITLTDTLPNGVTLDGTVVGENDSANVSLPISCSSAGQTVTCSTSTQIEPGQIADITIPIDVAPGVAGTLTNRASVTGGGALVSTSTSEPTTVSASPPPFGFLPGASGLSGSITNADGLPDTQAGSHPYQLTTTLNLPTSTYSQSYGGFLADGTTRDVTINLPAGVVVNPNATPTKCTEAQLEAYLTPCPTSSQVGTVTAIAFAFGGTSPYYAINPLYNMVPPKGVPAEFGFLANAIALTEHVRGSVRTGSDYGLSATSSNITAVTPLLGVQATLWGDPSDPSHNPQRGDCAFNPNSPPSTCAPVQPGSAKPFLTMPSACSGPLTTTASADSWENPGSFVTASAQTTDANGNPVGVSGCDRLDFTPTMTARPDVTSADSASGFDFGLSVPQSDAMNTLAEATLKKAVVTLPPGATLNPSAADGLAGCAPDQIQLDNASEPSCPDASKVGTVTIDSPLLSDPLTGSVYLATPFDNPFDALAAGYIVAQADGALIKLAGQFHLDPQTGQITASFDNNPQLPFTDLNIHFFGGPHGDLATPEACGTYPVSSQLTPWSTVTPDNSAGTATASPSDSFTIDSNCVTGFSPSFSAGTTNAQAGAYSPFVLSFSRSDSDEFFSGLSVKLPPGMLAKLAGVQECTDAQLASISTQPGTGIQEQQHPACPSGSQVGTVETSAGAGDPIQIPGKAYLTGPYKGAPYGLAVVVPAIAGPFDLGSVVVRQALYVDPTTAQVTDVSDPFPTILDGIPLRIREVDVNLNRPDFTVNPTSCDPMSVDSVFSSTLSVVAGASSRFQVGGCSSLGFSPKLKMSLTGKGKTKSGDHPNLISTLTQGSRQANIASARVALPLSMALDPNNSQVVCPYATAWSVTTGPADCPADTRVGSATADTPLLSQPLTGPVYLVQGLRCRIGEPSVQGTCPGGLTPIRTLPSLLVPLRGQIALDLRAQTSVNSAAGGKLVTTFSTIPDAAVSKFTLTITGGSKGLLVITGRGRTICGKPQVTDASFGAQSGKTESSSVTMATPCTRPRHKKHGNKHRRRR